MLLKIDLPNRPAITDAISANGLYRSFIERERIRPVGGAHASGRTCPVGGAHAPDPRSAPA
jgi:hypothetical protein